MNATAAVITNTLVRVPKFANDVLLNPLLSRSCLQNSHFELGDVGI